MKTHKQIIGDLGEGIACIYLEKRGFRVIERNYCKKWGEIDIITRKHTKLLFKQSDFLHFIEVKTVSRENLGVIYDNVNRETISSTGGENDYFRAEENLHSWKLKRLSRVIQTYLLGKDINEDQDWQFDVIIVYLDIKNKVSKIKYLENIIL